MIMARNIEDSLIESGAVAGNDYTYRDLYQLAAPFALEVFKSREDIKFTISSRE